RARLPPDAVHAGCPGPLWAVLLQRRGVELPRVREAERDASRRRAGSDRPHDQEVHQTNTEAGAHLARQASQRYRLGEVPDRTEHRAARVGERGPDLANEVRGSPGKPGNQGAQEEVEVYR